MKPSDQALKQAVGELPVSTAPSFEAFYTQYQHAWLRYAHAETGSRDAAEQITDAVTAHMADAWRQVQRPESAARHAWEVLKSTVACWLDEHRIDSAFVETATFERVTRVLARRREEFAAMDAREKSLGLYGAISRLPERQYDSIVLHFVLGYPYSMVACLLGVPEGTVRANVCHAKKRLAEELGPHLIETEA